MNGSPPHPGVFTGPAADALDRANRNYYGGGRYDGEPVGVCRYSCSCGTKWGTHALGGPANGNHCPTCGKLGEFVPPVLSCAVCGETCAERPYRKGSVKPVCSDACVPIASGLARTTKGASDDE